MGWRNEHLHEFEVDDVLRDRTHPEHRDMLAWVGRGFDPERFDRTAVNRKLRLLK
jgi:pRiA4b ORF-3-like protein